MGSVPLALRSWYSLNLWRWISLDIFTFSYRLYELNVNDANEIDWEDLAGAIGDVPPPFVQAKFYKLKAACVPFWQKKTFPGQSWEVGKASSGPCENIDPMCFHMTAA